MTDYRSLNHTKWACQYHVVFIPKYRKKVIYTELRRYLGDVLRRLAQRRESEVEEGRGGFNLLMQQSRPVYQQA